MLTSLSVRNFAIIDAVAIEFSPGLTVFTGETGAGKSILVESLSLFCRARASEGLIRSGENEAVVDAVFDLGARGEENEMLRNLGFDANEEVYFTRRIAREGQGRAFINRSPSKVQELAEICAGFFCIHGQRDQAYLQKTDFHRECLDIFGELTRFYPEGEKLFAKIKSLESRLEKLRSDAETRVHRIETLKHQIEEIEKEDFKRGDEELLEGEARILGSAKRFLELSGEVSRLLEDDEDSAAVRLKSAARATEKLGEIDGAFSSLANDLSEAHLAVEDAAKTLKSRVENMNMNPQRLDEVQQKLWLIDRLKRKHGKTFDELLDYFEEAKKEYSLLVSGGEGAEEIEKELHALYRAYEKWANKLSEARKKSAPALEKKMRAEFSRLALEKAQFCVSVSVNAEEGSAVFVNGTAARLSPRGSDRVEFLFSSNVGEPPKPLAKVASGGELSRLMLALEVLLVGRDASRVFIFDEVDQGIGGRVAEAVGERLHALARKNQVLCVTHLPQIAAWADTHFSVEKKAQKGKTAVDARRLNREERIEELARMLAGEKITDTARAHAKKLLDTASGRK